MRKMTLLSSSLSNRWLSIAAAIVCGVLVPCRANADEAVTCEIRSILGRDKKGGIDKGLSFLRRQLAKPPFTAFKSFKLLETKRLTLAQRKMGQTKLPTKKILRLTYKEKLLGPKRRVRLRMHLSITPPRALGYLPGTLFTIDDRGTLLVAGDPHAGGTLIVGITCSGK